MKSSGLNSLQLSYPVLVIGMILSSFLFLNFHILLPKSYFLYKNYEDNLRYKQPQLLFNENSFFHIDQKTFFAQSINGNELNKILYKGLSAKFEIDEFKQILLLTKKAKLMYFIPKHEPKEATILMKVRNNLSN